LTKVRLDIEFSELKRPKKRRAAIYFVTSIFFIVPPPERSGRADVKGTARTAAGEGG
jgi:hypothetical protein